MRCPERFPCTCARAADVAAHAVPGGRRIPSSEFSSVTGGEHPTQTSGVLGDGRGKSSLLWIVIIGPLTNPCLHPVSKKYARA